MTTTAERSRISALLADSRTLIATLQRDNGAYPASPSFSAYLGYCWFRDGAFIADAMSIADEADSASRFFDWCADVTRRHEARFVAAIDAARAGIQLPDEQMLPTRFTFDGAIVDDGWENFQLDGYGTWLWAAAAHVERHRIDPGAWLHAAELTVDYLVSSWDRPCYDWWEEHCERQHISTLGCIAAGLRSAARSGLVAGDRAETARSAADAILRRMETEGVHDGHLVKWVGSPEVDASLSALVAPLGVIDPSSDLARATVDAVERQLSHDGGVHRFRADTFYGGGQWPLLSCFLGLARNAMGDATAAGQLLAWAASTATDESHLPEQVDRHLLFPERRQEWVERWGTVATPLLWSHAMLLRLAHELGLEGGDR